MKSEQGIKQRLRKKFGRWLSRRIPASSNITLSHKSIFILPTGFGFSWLLLVVILFVFGTNYQNNLVMGLSFLLFSVFNTCIIYSYKNLAGLSLTRLTSVPDTFAGQLCYVPILHSCPNEAFEIYLSFAGQQVEIIKKVSAETGESSLGINAPVRGCLRPGRIKVESRFPLGICRVWSHVDLNIEQIVFAKPIKANLALTNIDTDNNIDSAGKFVSGVDEFSGLKQYVEGESLKQIAWKQLAQGRGMLTKEFQQPQGAPLWITLDNNDYNLEVNLSQLSWQVEQLSSKQQIFGLKLPAVTVAPNHGEQHRINVQTQIALYHQQQGMHHA